MRAQEVHLLKELVVVFVESEVVVGTCVLVLHFRNVLVLEDGFEESGHLSKFGSLDMYEICKALYENGFEGYVRPDHGRQIWGEKAKPGYGLYDRALGATYFNGLWEAIEKEKK